MQIPNIAERAEDVPVLVQNLLESRPNEFKPLSIDALRRIQLYHWPADYGELQEAIEAALDNAQDGEIQIEDFPHHFQMALKALANPRAKFDPIDLDQLLSEIETDAIHRAIEAANGNKTNAARLLGITRARLHRKIAAPESSRDESA